MKNKFVFFLFIMNFYSCNMISRQQLADKKLGNLLDNARIMKRKKLRKVKIIKRKRRLKSFHKKFSQMSNLERLGFKKGMEFEKKNLQILKRKRKLNGGETEMDNEKYEELKKLAHEHGVSPENVEEFKKFAESQGYSLSSLHSWWNGEEEPNPELEEEQENFTKGALGVGALGLGTLYKHHKNAQFEKIKKMFKEQYVHKNAIISLIDQEIHDLHFITAKLSSTARRIGNTESSITQRIQGKIFDLYEKKN